jgi:hypothetical protein
MEFAFPKCVTTTESVSRAMLNVAKRDAHNSCLRTKTSMVIAGMDRIQHVHDYTSMTCDPGRADRVNLPRVLSPSRRGYSPLCQSASRVKLIRGLSSTSTVENLWTTRLGTAYC